MSEATIKIRVGEIVFSASGDAVWLATQFDKVLKAAPSLQQGRSTPKPRKKASKAGTEERTEFRTTLASHIKLKGGDSSQVMRFLATADWLRQRGEKTLTTRLVSSALKTNQQKRLANAADCLNKNVSKGYCEKDGSSFFITHEGLTKLGYDE